MFKYKFFQNKQYAAIAKVSMLVAMLVAEVKYSVRALSGWIFLLLPRPFAKVLLAAKNFVNALSWASEMGRGFLITVHLIPSTQGGTVKEPG